MALFKGAGVAIVTPFEKDGSVNYKKLEELTGYSKDLLVQHYGQEQVDQDAQYLKVADFIISNAVRVTAPAEEAAEETESAEESTEAADAGTKAEETTAAN